MRIITDPQARYAALDSEEIMGVLDLGAMPAALGDELLKDQRFEMCIRDSPTPIWWMTSPNTASSARRPWQR